MYVKENILLHLIDTEHINMTPDDPTFEKVVLTSCHANTIYRPSDMQISELHIHKLQNIITHCTMIPF